MLQFDVHSERATHADELGEQLLTSHRLLRVPNCTEMSLFSTVSFAAHWRLMRRMVGLLRDKTRVMCPDNLTFIFFNTSLRWKTWA